MFLEPKMFQNQICCKYLGKMGRYGGGYTASFHLEGFARIRKNFCGFGKICLDFGKDFEKFGKDLD